MSNKYGALVYSAMAAIFPTTPCTHYKDDFHVHDRNQLESITVPGMEYIWAVRETGTYLVPLGIGEMAIGSIDSGHRQYYWVQATNEAPKIQPIDREIALAKLKAPVRISSHFCVRNGGESSISLYKGQNMTGSAQVSCRHDAKSNKLLVTVKANINHKLTNLDQMLTYLAMEKAVNTVVGSLFWVYESCTINKQERQDWMDALTAIPAKSESAFVPAPMLGHGSMQERLVLLGAVA
jgi:hypothetical protein